MSTGDFEKILAYHCAAVLMGIKPSNLVSVSRKAAPNLTVLMDGLNRWFRKEDISMEVLCSCNERAMILVYRKSLLEDYLKGEQIQNYMQKAGYPAFHGLDEYLRILKERYVVGRDFPHEIGIFLGYPLEDVCGFQRFKGREYKFCGYWKVYGDVERARALFGCMDRCRQFTCGLIENGYSLRQIVGMKEQCTQLFFESNCLPA